MGGEAFMGAHRGQGSVAGWIHECHGAGDDPHMTPAGPVAPPALVALAGGHPLTMTLHTEAPRAIEGLDGRDPVSMSLLANATCRPFAPSVHKPRS